jgi:hypothetical protein
MLPDGTLTVHDNGTNLGRPPRAVHYQIDDTNMTATLLDQQADPASAPTSGCCGSARRLADGGWLVDWGGTPTVEELTSGGSPAVKLTFSPATVFSYRATPIAPGVLSAQALRDGMNAQYPR